MNFLVVSQYFWPESFRINELVESLVIRGHTVDVLTGKPNYPDGVLQKGYSFWKCESSKWRGAKICRVPIAPRGKKSILGLAINYMSFVFSATLLGPWLLRKSNPDIVFIYAPSPLIQALPAIFIGRLKQCKIVLNVQDPWPESITATGYLKNRFAISLIDQLVRIIYKNVDMILISSRPFYDLISKYKPSAKIFYYPNSVGINFGNSKVKLIENIPSLSDGFKVVFAGNVGSAQAVQVIVDVAEKLQFKYPEIRFIVLGNGSELAWMQNQKDERQIRNLYLEGRFPVDVMPYMLSKASVLLVTLADHPVLAATVPNKIQAYLAVGRPIIACLNGEGARIIEESGAGITVAAEDSIGLAKAVESLYAKERKAREEMGARGVAYFQANFEHDRLVGDLINYCESLLSGSN